MNPKKPLHNTHKINFATFTKKTAKEGLNCRVFGEIDEVINVQSKQERMFQGWGVGLMRIADKSREGAQIFEGWS
jgi:hypothetical protein